MSWRGYQRLLEIASVLAMMAGVILMWMRLDSNHYLVYGGFMLLASGKLMEALNLHDPNFKIIKISACLSIYALVSLHLVTGIRTIVYILIPLAIYYVLHYRLVYQQKRS